MSRKFAIPYWVYSLLVLVFGYMLYNVWYSSQNIGHLNAEHIRQLDYIEDISQDLIDSHLWLAKYLVPPHDSNYLKTYRAMWKEARIHLEKLRQLVHVHSRENEEGILHGIHRLNEQLQTIELLAQRRIADPAKGAPIASWMMSMINNWMAH